MSLKKVNIRDLWYIVKRCAIHVTKVPEINEKETRTEKEKIWKLNG